MCVLLRWPPQCLRYVLERGCKLTPAAFTAAAGRGHLHILELLHQQGVKADYQALQAAIASQCWECLRFLLMHSPTRVVVSESVALKIDSADCFSVPCVRSAAFQRCDHRSCSLQQCKLLKYMHEQGMLRWDENLSVIALQFLCEHGCPLTTEATTAAAAVGSVDSSNACTSMGARE